MKTIPVFGNSDHPRVENLQQLHRVDFALQGRENLDKILIFWRKATEDKFGGVVALPKGNTEKAKNQNTNAKKGEIEKQE